MPDLVSTQTVPVDGAVDGGGVGGLYLGDGGGGSTADMAGGSAYVDRGCRGVRPRCLQCGAT